MKMGQSRKCRRGTVKQAWTPSLRSVPWASSINSEIPCKEIVQGRRPRIGVGSGVNAMTWNAESSPPSDNRAGLKNRRGKATAAVQGGMGRTQTVLCPNPVEPCPRKHGPNDKTPVSRYDWALGGRRWFFSLDVPGAPSARAVGGCGHDTKTRKTAASRFGVQYRSPASENGPPTPENFGGWNASGTNYSFVGYGVQGPISPKASVRSSPKARAPGGNAQSWWFSGYAACPVERQRRLAG